jgi:hypothetical protein
MSILSLAMAAAMLTQSACTPFFYGGYVVFGDPKEDAAAASGERP